MMPVASELQAFPTFPVFWIQAPALPVVVAMMRTQATQDAYCLEIRYDRVIAFSRVAFPVR